MSSIDYITVATNMLSMNQSNQSNQSMNPIYPVIPKQSRNREAIIAEKMEIEINRRDIIMSERFERHLMAYRQRKM